jgi:hypothetical protein
MYEFDVFIFAIAVGGGLLVWATLTRYGDGK